MASEGRARTIAMHVRIAHKTTSGASGRLHESVADIATSIF
jgi:hypothetical protein